MSTNPKQASADVRVPLDLCPPIVQVRIAALFRKVNQLPGRYAFNWRDNEVSLKTYLAAIKRHIAKLEDGEWLDSDTGESHITMMMGNGTIILDGELYGTLQHDLPKGSGKLSALMADYSAKYKAEIPEGIVKYEDGKDCGDANCKAAECMKTRTERMAENYTAPSQKALEQLDQGIKSAKTQLIVPGCAGCPMPATCKTYNGLFTCHRCHICKSGWCAPLDVDEEESEC